MAKLWNVLFVSSTIFLLACSDRSNAPALSGIIWGGEGNRLTITPATGNLFIDTLLIDNHGRFVWTPDTVESGFFILQKNPENQILLVLQHGKPIVIDAQYFSFPKGSRAEGFVLHENFLALKEVSKQWHNDLDNASALTTDSMWKPGVEEIKALRHELDSITESYRQKVLSLSQHPLVRMVGLMQTSGNRPLFDMWTYRDLYFEVDSTLGIYSDLREVRTFRKEVAKLYEMQMKHGLLKAGDSFPDLILSINKNDTVRTADLKESPVFIGLFDASDSEQAALQTRCAELLRQYRWRGMKAVYLNFDSTEVFRDVPQYYYMNLEGGLAPDLKEELGIVNMPACFVLTQSGIIAARNVWDDRLQQVIGQLVEK